MANTTIRLQKSIVFQSSVMNEVHRKENLLSEAELELAGRSFRQQVLSACSQFPASPKNEIQLDVYESRMAAFVDVLALWTARPSVGEPTKLETLKVDLLYCFEV
jgi:hypothetical protein